MDALRSQLPHFFPPVLTEIVVAYASPLPKGTYRSDRLECAGNEPLQGTSWAFALRKSDGSVHTWSTSALDKGSGDSSAVQARLKNVKAICASGSAFAAIVGEDHTVVTWGHKGLAPHEGLGKREKKKKLESGGDCSSVAGELKDVEGICATKFAFAALKRDGTVKTWGHQDFGGCSFRELKGVQAIYSSSAAFAAVLHDGTVETWGGAGASISPSVKARLKRVQCISGSDLSFAALLEDGTVETWGDGFAGRGGDSMRGELKGVVAISSTVRAFAALRSDGTVVIWGEAGYGGDCSAVREQLQRVELIRGSGGAFAALRSDGTVVTWGNKNYGGDSSRVQSDLWQVVAIHANYFGFTAQRSDCTVVTWSAPFSENVDFPVLEDVVSFGSSEGSFAAVRADGSVVSWVPSSDDFEADEEEPPRENKKQKKEE